MPVDEAAVDQLPAADANNQGIQDRSGFLGDSVNEETLDTEQPETSVEGEESEIESAETGEAQTEGEVESGETSVEEWLQDLTARESADYEKRYPSSWAKLNDPDYPQDSKQLLMDKINSDRFIAEQKALIDSYQSAPIVQEEAAEEIEPETEQVATAEQTAQIYQQQVDGIFQLFEPSEITALGKEVLSAFGADFGLDLSKVPQDQRANAAAELQRWNQAAPKVGEVLGKFGSKMLATAIPNLMERYLPTATEKVWPGMVEASQEAMEQRTWSKAYSEIRGNAEDLPAFGTKEFFTAMNAAVAKFPGGRDRFDSMVFTGKDGKPLGSAQQAKASVDILVSLMRGERPNVAVVAKALDTGAKLATKTANKKAAGRALGAGNSSRSFDTSKGGDDFLSGLDREISAHNSNMSPLGAGRK